jgi:hypothetical protein
MQVKHAFIPLVAISLLVACSVFSTGCSATSRIATVQNAAQNDLNSALESNGKAKSSYEAGDDPRPDIDDSSGHVNDAKNNIGSAQELAPQTEDKNVGILAGIEDFGKWVIYVGIIAICLGAIYLAVKYGWLMPRRQAARVANIAVKAQDPNSEVSTSELIAVLRASNTRIDAAFKKEKTSG